MKISLVVNSNTKSLQSQAITDKLKQIDIKKIYNLLIGVLQCEQSPCNRILHDLYNMYRGCPKIHYLSKTCL